MCSCKFSWIVKPYICWNVVSVHFRHTYPRWMNASLIKEGPTLKPCSSKLSTCQGWDFFLPWLTKLHSKTNVLENVWSPPDRVFHSLGHSILYRRSGLHPNLHNVTPSLLSQNLKEQTCSNQLSLSLFTVTFPSHISQVWTLKQSTTKNIYPYSTHCH